MRFEVSTEGAQLSNWKSVRVTRAFGQLADAFELEAVPPPGAPLLRPGARVELSYAGTLLATAWVDEIRVERSVDDHLWSVSGRSVTADLVDCSIERPSMQWRSRTLQQIATEVCKPFSIAVELTPEGAMDPEVVRPIARAALQDGESAFELLERLSRQVGALLSTGPQGQLRIGSPLALPVATTLTAGKNLLSCVRVESHKERFSRYIVRGQTSSSDSFPGDKAVSVVKTEDDNGIARFRPLVVLAETPGDNLAARAVWERRSRWGQSLSFEVEVVGWAHAKGVWAPGDVVRLRDSLCGVDDSLLVTAVTLELSESGEIARLTLQPEEAVSSAPVPPAAADPNAWALGPARGWVNR